MLQANFTNKFKKDVKRIKKRNKDISKLNALIQMILSETELPREYKDHPLRGDQNGNRDAHIEPDWLLIYHIDEDNQEAVFVRTGTHSDLF